MQITKLRRSSRSALALAITVCLFASRAGAAPGDDSNKLRQQVDDLIQQMTQVGPALQEAQKRAGQAADDAKDAKKQAGDAVSKAEQTKAESVDAKRDSAEAKTDAAAAKKDSSDAKTAVEEAKLDTLKVGKFIQFGVTAGFSFAIMSESIVRSIPQAEQRNWTSTTMPYLLFVPGYWGGGDVTNAYCAAAWGADSLAAQKKANKMARDLTIERKASLKEHPVPDGQEPGPESIHEATGWNTGHVGSCGWRKIGFWVGKPISYDASVSRGEGEYKHQVDSLFALGAAYVPNSYVTFLVGISMNSLEVPAKAATSTTAEVPGYDKHMVSVILGFGGNLDIVGSVFK